MKTINYTTILLILMTQVWCGVSAQNATPKTNADGTLYFEIGSIYFEVDPQFGGRISSFQWEGEEILFGRKEPAFGYLWGSTLWQSPQSAWGWPPSVALDQGPYSGGIAGDSISLLSEKDATYNTSLTIRKIFRGNLADTTVNITYSLINNSLISKSFSSWEVTRVPAEGMAFFPYGSGNITGAFANQVEKANGIAWYTYETNDPKGQKYFSDGAGGWDAWLSDNRLLFIRKFEDVASNQQAPGEKEIELWFNDHNSYIELEIQSAYTSIPAGDSLIWDVTWYLRKLPAGISDTKGSVSLIDYVNAVLNPVPVGFKPGRTNPSGLFNVFPNPTSGVTNFQTDSPTDLPAKLTLYNVIGQVVFVKHLESNRVSLDLSHLPGGLYHYTIHSPQNGQQNGKLLLVK